MGGNEHRSGGAQVNGSARASHHLAGTLLLLMSAMVVGYVATAPVSRAAAHPAEAAAPVPVSVTVPAAAASAAPTAPPPPAPQPAPQTAPGPSPTAAPRATTPAAPPPQAAAEPAAAPAAAPQPSAAAARPARRLIGVVGDSLSFSVAGLLGPRLEAVGLAPLVDVVPGRRIPVANTNPVASAGVDAAEGVAAFHPSLWIVQLGTNDVFFEQPDRDHYAALIAAMLDQTGRDVPVVWVNVWRKDRATASRLFDEVLQQTALVDPHLHVADWATVARSEPVLGADGVHLDQAGEQRFIDTIMNTASLALLAG
jgi:lysophospholipase L1-like esterase